MHDESGGLASQRVHPDLTLLLVSSMTLMHPWCAEGKAAGHGADSQKQELQPLS